MASIKGKVLPKKLFTNHTFLASNCNIRLYKYASAPLHAPALIYTISQREGGASKACAYGTCSGAMEGKRDGQNQKEVYEKLSEKIRLWEEKKKKNAKRKLHRTERGVEKEKLKAMQRFTEDNERIENIVASARTHAYESQVKEELNVKEKANLMRTTGRSSCTCL